MPFRLTQNIVDGFGVTGVDGTFRRCSEHTLRVLCGSAELIMTVLEVFKHDPLYAWCVIPLSPPYLLFPLGGTCAVYPEIDLTRFVGPETPRRCNEPRAVPDRMYSSRRLACRKKPKGVIEDRVKLRDDLSVEYAVNALIQQARDPENLARIFTGWHSWF